MRFSKKQLRIICWVLAAAMILVLGAGVVSMFTGM